jgi:hypothetical protein
LFGAFVINIEISTNRLTRTSQKIGTHPTISALLRGTNNGEYLKMAVGHQEFSTSFARAVNHAAEDELAEDLLQQVISTTLEEELSPPYLDDVANYFSLAEEEVEFQDLEQEVKPETSPIEL